MWQDWYFAAAGLLYSAVMIPSLRDPKTEIPRRSSVLTAVALSCSAVAYASLGMWLASASCAVGASVWAFLGRYRPIRVEQGWRMTLTDEREMEVVEQYRTWVRQQQLLAEAGGGCGGCPSKGSCSDAQG
jgi:hypothetical protein